ncbi:MAG: hypothetical protein FWD69_04280 [Polyangiaceae bacterium]|nr:hypothetical protein [Polyangiaceae bacterium]
MSTLLEPLFASSPFDQNHADPWSRTFIDLPSLNAKITNAISAAIQNVRVTARTPGGELRTWSILVLGPAGAGKTHLFARLRHKLGPRAIFVHLRPLLGTEMTPRYVLGQIIQHLAYETTEGTGLRQLEALVGASLAQLEGSNPDFPRVFVNEVAALDETTRAEKIEWAVEKLLLQHQEADETYLTRLLTTPFMKPPQQRAALAWLAGRELEESQMQRLRVTAGLPEERIIQALRTLGIFAAPGAPVVLVFDQLENLMDGEATGARVRAYANLVAELFDMMRGYVLVQMALDSEWQRGIVPELSEAQKTRLGGTTQIIALPTPAQVRELIARWVEYLPQRDEPFPWPFGHERVAKWAETPGMTPRMLMIACRDALALGPNASLEEQTASASEPATAAIDGDREDAALEVAWGKHLQHARIALDEAAEDRRSADPARLVGGIACALRFTSGVTTSRIDARHHLQILARRLDRPFAVAFLHQKHPKSAITALERASEASTEHAVFLVRERSMDLPPTWKKVHATLATVVRKGARFIVLERDDAARLLALESFLAAAKSRDLEDTRGHAFSDNDVTNWIDRSLRITTWPIIAAMIGTEKEAQENDDPVEPISARDPGVDEASAPEKADVASTSKRAEGIDATIRACIGQLRIASLERLVREVVRAKPDATRTEIVTAIDDMPKHVRWFGRAIVAVRGAR